METELSEKDIIKDERRDHTSVIAESRDGSVSDKGRRISKKHPRLSEFHAHGLARHSTAAVPD
jgi:hypothetical protein